MFSFITIFKMGIILLIIGSGIIKNAWKDEEAKIKHEKRSKVKGKRF